MDDDAIPTLEQRVQQIAGRQMAHSAWLGALISNHPDHATLEKVANDLALMATEMLALRSALQGDDGFRVAFGSEMRALS